MEDILYIVTGFFAGSGVVYWVRMIWDLWKD